MTDAASTTPELPGLTVERLLGRGGFAEVFLCEQQSPRMRVAVKVLSGEGLSDEARARFAAEANAMAVLADHPYIVQVFHYDVTSDGRPYLVMKYYPQANLGVRSRAEQIPVPEVLQIGVRIASAVETAHRAGILHRDIKPANILTSQFGEPGLTDFGIATMAGVDANTQSEGMSIPWSPPEVVFGTSSGDRAADIYGLGATLWHLLAGRSPFEIPGGENSNPTLMRRIKDMPAPRTGRPDVPASLERILSQALAKDPTERPDSALAFARSLQAVETEQRWAPTPLVVEETAGEVRPGTARSPTDPIGQSSHVQDDSLATRRRPTGVVAQSAPARLVPAPSAGVGDYGDVATRQRAAARPRVGIPGAVEASPTIRRPAATEPSVSDSTRVDVRPARRGAVLAVAVAVVVLAVGIGLAVSGGHGTASPSASTTLAASPPTLAVQAAAVPSVTATRLSATEVRFSWSDPDAVVGDEFLYSVDGGNYVSVGTRRQIVLKVPMGSSSCVTVEIDRSGLAGTPSPVTCNGSS